MNVSRILSACLLAAGLGVGTPAQAQPYPSRPVTIIVPFAAGGGTDVVARAMAPALSQKLGQSIIIENVTGAAGNIAAARVARSAPDGYTLVMHNLALALNAGLYAKLPYDTDKDFQPIAMINHTANVYALNRRVPVNNLAELVDYMKKTPLKLAHPGVGSTGFIQVALLAKVIGANADFIPYRGAGPMLQDIIAGHVDMGTVTLQNAVEPVKAGLVKGMGISSAEPSKLLPQVPSIVKGLHPSLEVVFWNVLLAPAGTPRPIVDKIHAAFEDTVKDQALVEGWAKLGIDLYPPDQRTPEATRAIMRRETERWGRIIRENKMEIAQ
jgi:tripartite-type tricarboxylate transporter receptor subunit TctC